MSAYDKLILAESSLQSYWPLDESSGTVYDQEGSVNGVVISGVTQGVTGLLNEDDSTAYSFNGTSGEVNFGDNHDLSATADWSVEFIMQASSLDATQVMIGKRGEVDGDERGWLIYLGSTNKLTVLLTNSEATNNQIRAYSNSLDNIQGKPIKANHLGVVLIYLHLILGIYYCI